SAIESAALASMASTTIAAINAPRATSRTFIRLPFLVQTSQQHFAALLRLPDLVGIFVVIHFQKFLVSIVCGLGLVQFIVAKCADKPRSSARSFRLGNFVHHR